MTKLTWNNAKERNILQLFLAIISGLIIFDLAIDFSSDTSLAVMILDAFIELSILATVTVASLYVWQKYKAERNSRILILKDLSDSQQNAFEWELKSKNYIKEFQKHVMEELTKWNLSKSEKEIALLLLQGKSSKEIAALRFTSERTIRNQCQSVYEKSQLNGRNELTSYFFSELFSAVSMPV